MKLAIAIFVKTPGVSPLKTRLAATIGQEKAEHFYRLSLKCIVSTIKNIDITANWAIAEKQCLDNSLWNDFNQLHTGEGDLGERQSHIYHELLKTHDGAMLIGADAPQISVEIIQQAMEVLKTDEYVIGPANDGGYYLLAGRKPIASEVWSSTPWSHEKTREKLVNQLDSTAFELSMLTDVDYEADLHLILNEMPANQHAGLNEDHLILKDWINQL